MITTRHESHGPLTLQCLQAGKHVFVEKPLCINRQELTDIQSFYKKTENPPMLMVGFNRRFSPYLKEIKKHTQDRVNPVVVHYRMNAGYIPTNHWTHEHGGRIIGEACHLIDLMNYLTDSKIESISTEHITPTTEKISKHDNRSIVLKYSDGSLCHIQYFAVGNKKLSKEYMEVHFDEKSIVMDNYKKLTSYGFSCKEISSSISNKGQYEELEALYETLKVTGSWPISLDDIVQTTLATFEIEEN